MKVLNNQDELEEVYSSLPGDTRQLVKVIQAFTGTVAVHTRILEEVLSNGNKVSTYFLDAHGGFRDDIITVQDTLRDLHNGTRDLVASENKKVIDATEQLAKKMEEVINKAINKIIVLLLASSAIIGFIVYVIEKTIITSSSTEIVKEVLKNMGK